MKKIFVLVASLFLCTLFAVAQNNVIDNGLQKILNQKSSDYIDVNIMLKAQMTKDDFAVLNCKSDSKDVRREIVINELKKFAEKSQRDVMSVINAEERSNSVIDIKSYWIANFINCKAKADVIYKLASHPDVALITYNSDMDIVSNTVSETDSRAVAATSDIYPHLTQIKADKVWDLGYTGKGVIVAVLDSGTNLNHDDIKDHLWNENGKYGYNVHSPNSLPSDEGSNGHGSHCAGVVCGDGTSGKKTGVAPDAKLMTIKIVGGGRCTAANLVEGVQKAANLGADVISLSIGRENPDENRALFRQTFTSLLQTGIAAAVAAGNDGNSSTNPAPDNVRTPGDCPPPWIHPDQQGNAGGLTSVISVGAVNENNVVSPSSSKGPVTWQSISGYNDYPYNPGIGLIRPDIAAPGENVYSIKHDANNTYWGKSGTSMATPCVAGVMALMLEKNPDLTPADLCRIIETTASNKPATKNNSIGSGVIDALAAVQAVNFNDPVVINPYAFTSTLNAGSNINLQLTLINNGSSSTSGTTSVTISENDNYTTIVQGSKTYSAMAAGATASATFVVNIDPLVEDNHVVTFTVTATNGSYSRTFEMNVNISNELVAPTLTATANGTNVNLTWNATNNATSYNIYRDGAFLANTPSTSYTDAGLEYGTLYAYTVTSKRGELESDHSLVARAQTTDNPAKPSPTNVIANNNGVVTWTNGAESKGSNIYRKDVNTSVETPLATNVNGSSYTDNNWNSLADGIYQYGVANLYAQNNAVYTENFTSIYLTDRENTYQVMNAYWYIYQEGVSAGGLSNNYKWNLSASTTNQSNTYSAFSGNAAFIQTNYTNDQFLSYLVMRPMTYNEAVKLSFKYITPAWGGSINTLKVMVSTTSYNSGWTELWSSNKTDVKEWTDAVVDLSAYTGQQIYIAFVNVAGYGYCTGVDEVSILAEKGSSESRIEWSNNVYKNVNIFVQDGLWSNTDNWITKRLPTENDTKVIIDANAIVSTGNIVVNSLIINEGMSLTLNSGTTLTVNNDFANTDADAFIINDGAQVFQNNDDVAATFNMNIVTPGDWSNNHKNGWQFISSPVKGAKIDDFIPTTSDYDLYKYDGTKELEWINHKDENTYEPEPVAPDAPQNLVATATSHETIELTWNAVNDATRYKVYKDGNLIAQYVYNPSYTVNSLTQATTYCFTVVAVNNEDIESVESNEACATTDITIPSAPQNLVADATPYSATLRWDAVAGATSYNIYLLDEVIGTTTSPEYTITGLDPEETYVYHVSAVNAKGESAKTGVEFTTPLPLPDAPQNLVATAVGSAVELTWTASFEATSYKVYDDKGLVAEGISSTNYTVYDLEAGQHCFTVTAVNAVGESGASNTACAKTTAQDPDTPIAEHVIIGDGNSTTGMLPLQSNQRYSISQQIYTRAEIGQTGDIKSVSFKYKSGLSAPCTRTVKVYLKHTTKEVFASKTDWVSMTNADLVYDGNITINGIADEWVRIKLNTPFEYTGNNLAVCVYDYTNSVDDQIIFAADEIGDAKAMYYSPWTNPAPLNPSNLTGNGNIPSPTKRNQIRFSFVTGNEPAIPAAPSNLIASCSQEMPDIDVYANAITLKWDVDATAETYHIYDEADNKIGQTGGTTFTIEGLECATRYCYYVSAENETGEGAKAEVCTTTITEVPQNVAARSTDETTINMSWDPVETATSYKIYLSDLLVGTSTTTSFDITGLTTGNTYCHSVTAVNEGGESKKSALGCAKAGDIQLETIPLTFTLRDNWGDGWNGNKLSVSYPELEGTFNGTYTINETTFDPYPYNASKRYTYTFTLEIPKGCNVTLTYIKSNGANPATNENSFDVKCENGTVLISVAEGSLAGGEVFEFIADCTLPLPNAPVLEANATSSTEIALTWNEVSGATSYNVYQGSTRIANGLTETSYNVTGLTANTEYCFKVTAVNTTGESDASEEVCEKTEVESFIVEIGKDSNEPGVEHPSWNLYNYSFTQQIYTAAELGGQADVISAIAFRQYKDNTAPARDIDVYMLNTNKSTFTSKTDYVTVSDADLVYSGNLKFKSAGDWITLNLTKNFEYTGGNIIICVNDKTGTCTNTATQYYVYKTDGNRCLAYYRDGAPYDPTAPDGTSKVLAKVNQINITFGEGSATPDDPVAPNAPTTFFYDFNDGNLDDFNLIDSDGDGNNWGVKSWYGQDLTELRSYSWGESALNPNNYIITKEPYLITETSKLIFRCSANGSDRYGIYLSDDENIEDSELVYQEKITQWGTWYDRLIELGNYVGVKYIAIRHFNSYGQYYISIDDFQLTDGSAKSSAPAKMTDIKGGFDKVSAFGTSSGTELSKFETTFLQGVGYLVSYESDTLATFKGTLNHEDSYVFKLDDYDNIKNVGNFNLLGNPFSFNMDLGKVIANNLVNGYAIVNEDGAYEYLTTGEIKVGDGFLVKVTGENPTMSYNTRSRESENENCFLNVISSGKDGNDNVIINLAGEQEGFPKIENFNEDIALVYIPENDLAYGIYNYNSDATEAELVFKTKRIGEYNIHIEPNGDFEYVTLVDQLNGTETNMLTSSYSFTAVPQENGKRFLVRFAKGEGIDAQDNFAYQSSHELIINRAGVVQIIDVMGRVVYSNDVTTDNNRIDISKLDTAVYVIRLINEDGVKTQKIVLD